MRHILASISFFLLVSFDAQAIRHERPLTCPKKATFPGSLVIGLGPRHGAELVVVRRSDGARFVLVSKDKELLMPSEDFKRTVFFEFNMGAEWEVVGGDGATQPIFNGAGIYEVVVGNFAASTYDGHKCVVEVTE
jgi:hypothetical protein